MVRAGLALNDEEPESGLRRVEALKRTTGCARLRKGFGGKKDETLT
jgi:hypothetical protein